MCQSETIADLPAELVALRGVAAAVGLHLSGADLTAADVPEVVARLLADRIAADLERLAGLVPALRGADLGRIAARFATVADLAGTECAVAAGAFCVPGSGAEWERRNGARQCLGAALAARRLAGGWVAGRERLARERLAE
jgi:hypothetical protein